MSRPVNRPDNMYITRFIKPKRFWNLRFRYKGKVIHREAFKDDVYGSGPAALQAAIRKRDRIAKDLNFDLDKHWGQRSIKPYRYTHKKLSKRNTSGVTGVYLWVFNERRYWKASISWTRNRESSKCFNVDTLGEEEAFKSACLQRLAWEEELLKGGRYE